MTQAMNDQASAPSPSLTESAAGAGWACGRRGIVPEARTKPALRGCAGARSMLKVRRWSVSNAALAYTQSTQAWPSASFVMHANSIG